MSLIQQSLNAVIKILRKSVWIAYFRSTFPPTSVGLSKPVQLGLRFGKIFALSAVLLAGGHVLKTFQQGNEVKQLRLSISTRSGVQPWMLHAHQEERPKWCHVEGPVSVLARDRSSQPLPKPATTLFSPRL